MEIRYKIGIVFLSIITVFCAKAQEKDSIVIDGWLDGLDKPVLDSPILEQPLKIGTSTKDLSDLVPMPDMNVQSDPKKIMPMWHWEGLNMPYFATDRTALHMGDYNVGGIITANRNHLLYGSGDQQHIVGIGANASATLGYAWLINPRLSVTASTTLQKTVGMMPNALTYGTLGGTLNYQINDRLSVHAFGNYNVNTYDFNQWSWNYGGYLDWQMSEHWGTKFGAQHTQDYTGYGRTTPIVMPYYKMENGAKIGIDFGGLIQNLIDSKHGKQDFGPGIMPSPKQFISMPRVAPRN